MTLNFDENYLKNANKDSFEIWYSSYFILAKHQNSVHMWKEERNGENI